MSRIVAGSAGGRRLAVPRGRDTRPTSDRVREALFSSLQAAVGSLEGVAFLDLYAGSGAVGLEALSRGAEAVLLVEADRRAASVIKRNVAAVGLPGATVCESAVERVLAGAPRARYDIVYLDPPYTLPDEGVHQILVRLAHHGWLQPAAVIVVERPTRGGEFDWPPRFAGDRSRRYGDATLWYGHAAAR